MRDDVALERLVRLPVGQVGERIDLQRESVMSRLQLANEERHLHRLQFGFRPQPGDEMLRQQIQIRAVLVDGYEVDARDVEIHGPLDPPEPQLSGYTSGVVKIGGEVWTQLKELRAKFPDPDDGAKVTYALIEWIMQNKAVFQKVFPEASGPHKGMSF